MPHIEGRKQGAQMERLFLRERKEEKFVDIFEKQKIGVVGMNRGAGASFVATSIASVLTQSSERKVTFLEVCDYISDKMSFMYDAIGVDKRFKTREFTRFYNEVKFGKNIKGRANFDEKINWALITPEDIKEKIELSPIEIVRLINNVTGDVIVCDISECNSKEDYLLDMDVVVFVIDPMPYSMITGYPFMREVKRLAYNGKKVIWVVNKFNAGINKRDMQNFLNLKEYYKIPAIESSDFYSAQYNCKLPYEMSNIHDHAKETVEKIVALFTN